jgi:hypothetical protein
MPPTPINPNPSATDPIWTAVAAANVGVCRDLIAASTSYTPVPTTAQMLILMKRPRLTFWVRKSDPANRPLLVLGFHTLDNTDHPARCPKYCICVGVDTSLVPAAAIDRTNPTYAALRTGVIDFKAQNGLAHADIVFQHGFTPPQTDRIFRFWECFYTYDLDRPGGEVAGGTTEYSLPTPGSASPTTRWINPLITWKTA